MKNLVNGLVAVGVICIAAQGASAEVTSLAAKFAGGCKTTSTGSCTIKATAEGTELEGDGVVLQRADSAKGRYRYVSKTNRTLSEEGTTSFKFRNAAGCYRVVTTPNGNDVPDVRSRTICEK